MISITTILVIGMLVSGCTNSLVTKFQDKQCVGGCGNPNTAKHFDQPVFQTLQMFIAESFCWIYVYYASRSVVAEEEESEQLTGDASDDADDGIEYGIENGLETHTKIEPSFLATLLFGIPAFCDICATTLMNMGLVLTPVSIYQMTRGAVVLFVGFFSTVFLKKNISRPQWVGLVSVFCGVFIVGLSSWFYVPKSNNDILSEPSSIAPSTGNSKIVLGIFLIFIAQVLTASQFVIEEFLLEKYNVAPIKIVSLEGTFGVSVIIVVSVMIIFLLTLLGKGPSNEVYRVFDLTEAFGQIFSSKPLLISSIIIMVAIATFNICGITITQRISATTRSTVDTCRTLGIWAISLIIGWETFNFLQLLGFSLLVYGTLLFNKLIGHQELFEHIQS